jgi:hypothetical protein
LITYGHAAATVWQHAEAISEDSRVAAAGAAWFDADSMEFGSGWID